METKHKTESESLKAGVITEALHPGLSPHREEAACMIRSQPQCLLGGQTGYFSIASSTDTSCASSFSSLDLSPGCPTSSSSPPGLVVQSCSEAYSREQALLLHHASSPCSSSSSALSPFLSLLHQPCSWGTTSSSPSGGDESPESKPPPDLDPVVGGLIHVLAGSC